MKRILCQTLAILGVNIVAHALVFIALLLFFSRNDPILAILPLLVAIPVLVVQPWSILFVLFVPNGALLSPLLTTAVSAPLFVHLDRTGELARMVPLLARLKRRKVLAVAAVVIIGVVAIGMARYVDFPAMRRGAPGSMAYFANELKLPAQDARFYCLGSFIDSEWLWRATLSEQDANRLFETLDMQPIPIGQVGDAYWRMPPYWWQPVKSDQTRLMATRDFPMSERGSDGSHYLASWNPADNVLYMWIKDNF